MQNNPTTDPELTSSQIVGEELLVFVGYSEDARDEAYAIKELEGKLQSEIHYLRTMGPMPFVNVKIWTWKDDAKPIVGGQSAVVDDALLRSKIAVFVFKERVGTTTKSEIARIKNDSASKRSIFALFPRDAPGKVNVTAVAVDWCRLLALRDELSADWESPESQALTPCEAYNDIVHIKEIAFSRFKQALGFLCQHSQRASSQQPQTPQPAVHNVDELRLLYEQTKSDRKPCPAAKISEIDWALIDKFSEKENLRPSSDYDDKTELLSALGLLAAVGPTNTLHHGAVLCFTQRPHLHIEGARAILLAGDKRDDGLVGETIEGPLSTQVERLVKLTISKLSSHWKFDKDGMRNDTLEIEPKVIREAISNAIAHRNYESAGTTKVEISKSFVDITNPGEFSADAPWQSLLDATSKTSSPKNAAISLYLNRLLAMEGVGRGFSVFKEYLEKNGPDSIIFLASTPGSVVVRISRPNALQSELQTRNGRVYLASTALDLGAYRQIADDMLLRLQQQSVLMERFGARSGLPVDECERLAAACDVLVCIVAHRYGFEPDPGRGSITRREVEAARNAGKPVYAWIVDEAYAWTEAKEQDRLMQPDILADPAKIQAVIEAVRALGEFKAWLRANVTVETFTTPDDLGRKIAITLSQAAGDKAARSPGAAAPPARPPELRVVHALQPAPHFSGRAALVATLSAWVDDLASPDRIQALVAAGGTGKTAIVEQVLGQLQQRWPQPGAGHVLVWSFYEKPDADAFLRECGQLFLGEPDDAPSGGRLERLQRGLRDGRPHLLVMDGLERIQSEAGQGRVRGELEDTSLRLLLQAIAAGLGRTRALLTSRFALTDLRDWQHRGVVQTLLDDLPADAARQVLRGWGVAGEDGQLDAVAAQLGRHALSVAVIGSYLAHFEAGRIEAAAGMQLAAVAGDDPKAAKLARVLAFYAQRLPDQERELLIRLAVFPRGITLNLLGVLLDAGGAVAGGLVNARAALPQLLARLVERGLVFRYPGPDATPTWTAHPFVRERFAGLLGIPASEVFGAVAERLGQGLDQRPVNKPRDVALLDRYEQLIEATRLAGRTQEAFDIYWFGLGSFTHLGWVLGDFARGYRILRSFVPDDGEPRRFGEGLSPKFQSVGLNDLALMATQLGRLSEALTLRQEDDARKERLDEPEGTSIGLQNTCALACDLGRLKQALSTAGGALAEAERAASEPERKNGLVSRANAAHLRGDISAARADFDAATSLENQPLLYSYRGQLQARHHLGLGDRSACRDIVEAGLTISRDYDWNHELPGWHALLARLALAEGQDPQAHLSAIRTWTALTGAMAWIIEAHTLAAQHALAQADLGSARAEAEDGLRQARLCGYRLLEIELLVTLSAIHLAWPDPAAALAAARQALDIATAADCGYAWGEADAAHAWGLAFVALGQPEPARRAFTQALAVRQRIGHPQAAATRTALAALA